MKKVILMGLLALIYGQTAKAEHYNQGEVLRAAEKLASEVEHFDEELHNVNAPQHVVQKVHHFEETVTEFADEVRNYTDYYILLEEMNHIRQDMRSIRDEMSSHPYLLLNPRVALEYRAMRRAYRWLDHAMYMGHHWNQAEVDAEIAEDIAFLEQHAAERANQ